MIRININKATKALHFKSLKTCFSLISREDLVNGVLIVSLVAKGLALPIATEVTASFDIGIESWLDLLIVVDFLLYFFAIHLIPLIKNLKLRAISRILVS